MPNEIIIREKYSNQLEIKLLQGLWLSVKTDEVIHTTYESKMLLGP